MNCILKSPSSTVIEAHARTASALPALLEKVYAARGWDFRGYKKTTLIRRITKRIQASHSASVGEYLEFLEKDPSEYSRLFSSITIKVSEFFREPEVFSGIQDIISSELDSPVRAWCCGCACGEEAYSIAMLLSECLGPDVLARTKVFATDIDSEALEQARRATYRMESVANVSRDFLERYFIEKDGLHKVKYGVRNLVKFGALDIVQSTPLSNMNLVLCRNLFIYFEKGLQELVFQKLDYSLRPGGILVLGKAEVLPSAYASRYAPSGSGLNIFRKKG